MKRAQATCILQHLERSFERNSSYRSKLRLIIYAAKTNLTTEIYQQDTLRRCIKLYWRWGCSLTYVPRFVSFSWTNGSMFTTASRTWLLHVSTLPLRILVSACALSSMFFSQKGCLYLKWLRYHWRSVASWCSQISAFRITQLGHIS